MSPNYRSLWTDYRVITPSMVSQRKGGEAVETSIAVDEARRLATVTVSGDIDLATAAVVGTAVETALSTPGVTAVVVDLSGVGFLDSSGISELLKGRRSADDVGAAYRITGAHGVALRVLEMSGVWAHLTGDASPNADQP